MRYKLIETISKEKQTSAFDDRWSNDALVQVAKIPASSLILFENTVDSNLSDGGSGGELGALIYK